MNIVEMYEKVKEIYAANENQYAYIGLRFEDKERELGEECEYSRHNADRDDEREFPAFGSEEYEEMDLLDGTSAWDLSALTVRNYPGYGAARNASKDTINCFVANHCYIVAGNRQGRHDDPDDGEIVIKDAVVIAKIF